MKLLRSFPATTFALVLVALIGLCVAQQSVELLLVSGSLAALSWYITEGPRGRTLPRWVSNILVIAASLFAVVDFLGHPNDPLGVLSRLAVWLTLIKLYERRSARDHAHLMALSLLLMLVGCLHSADLLFGVILLVYGGLGLYTLLLYQLFAAHEQATAERRRTTRDAAQPAPPLRPTIGRHTAGQFRALAISIAVVGMIMSIALFVIFPRNVGRGVIGRPFRAPTTAQVTGYTDEIDLVGGTRINESNTVVCDVRILDPQGRPTPGPEPLLLRGAALDQYDDGRWRALRRQPLRIETGLDEPVALGDPLAEPRGRIVRQQFRFLRGTETIFGLYLPTAIQTERPHQFIVDRATQTVETDAGMPPVRSYSIESLIDPTDEAVADLVDRTTPLSTTIPAGEWGRVRGLALEILERSGVPTTPAPDSDRWAWNERGARALAAYLRSPAYHYTLDISDVSFENEDPTIHFLTQSQRGHCEFFASGLAALCRSVGIEARVISGYAVSAYDERAERYTVLARNAHAWVEVRTGDYRFTPIDPSPPAALMLPTARTNSFADRLSRFYQRIEGEWVNRIVDFDARSQAGLFASLDVGVSMRVRSWFRSISDWMASVNRAFSAVPQGGYLWLGIVAFAGLLAVLSAIKIVRRVRALQRTLHLRRLHDAEARRLLRQLGFYVDMLVVLRKSGRAKPDWQPPLAFARAVLREAPRLADLVQRITARFYEGRYGGRRFTGAELAETRGWVHELAGQLKVRL